jgi:hypothetical protein
VSAKKTTTLEAPTIGEVSAEERADHRELALVRSGIDCVVVSPATMRRWLTQFRRTLHLEEISTAAVVVRAPEKSDVEWITLSCYEAAVGRRRIHKKGRLRRRRVARRVS